MSFFWPLKFVKILPTDADITKVVQSIVVDWRFSCCNTINVSMRVCNY